MHALRLPNAAAGTLLAVGVSQAADAITFVRLLLEHGPAAEANPLAATLAAQGHLGLLLLAKALVVVLVVLVVLLGQRRYPVAMALMATVGVGAGLLGASSNVFVLLQSSG